MTKKTHEFIKLRGLLSLVIGLIFLAACTPPEAETPTAVTTPVTTTTTLAAEPLTTARPTSTPSDIPTLEAIPAPTEDMLLFRTPNAISPTPTPRPSPTNTPFIPPPTRTVEWPQLNYDVLFLVDGSLKLWNHETKELEVLLLSNADELDPNAYPPPTGIIYGYQVSSDGQTILANRLVSFEPFVQEFILLDLDTRQSQIVVPPTPYIWNPSFSPDGRQIAYFVGEAEGFSSFAGPQTGKIVVKNLYDNEPAITIGRCINKTEGDVVEGKGCQRFGHRPTWSPDGGLLTWGDRRGVMVYEFSNGTIEIVQTHNYDLPDPYHRLAVYRPIDWSPNGRYLRLEAGHYEGNTESILDMETRKLFDIPNTFRYGDPDRPYVIWLADDRLFQVWPEGDYRQTTTHVEIWRPVPGSGDWVLDESLILPTSEDAFSKEPMQLADGSVILAMVSRADRDVTAGLYRLESLDSPPVQINLLPTIGRTWSNSIVAWAPDSSGAFLLRYGWEQESIIEYLTVGESVAYDLSFGIGYNILSIYWLP